MARQVGDVRIASQMNKTAIILDFAAMASGFIFTIGFNSFTATTTEEALTRSTSITSSSTSVVAPTTPATTPTTQATYPTMPATCHPLSCYKGRQIDGTDLLGLSTKLFGLLAAKNGATTTATTIMTTSQKARGPDNFVATD